MPRQYTPKVRLTCHTCGSVFFRTPGEVRKTGGKYCSRACINRKHGATSNGQLPPEYSLWKNIHARCNNPNHPKYADYGGRGIAVCPEWDSFERFLSDMGSRPDADHELDRIDNDGPYAPWNCRWATRTEQNNNTRRNVILEHAGRRMTLPQWAREVGLNINTLRGRIFEKGWPVEKALTTPVCHPSGGGRSRQ